MCHLHEYHFVKEKKTWTEAQQYCREHHTDLATVSNMTDMERLHDSAQNQDGAWIGLYSDPERNERGMWHWQWSTDKVILIKENMTWEDALYYCEEKHHDLVSITNPDEQRWVQEKAKKADSPYVWLGLRYTCTLGFWFWIDDKMVTYKNWVADVPADDCDMSGAMDRGGEHKWFKKNDNEKFNFICSTCQTLYTHC
ncbi:C-type lectin lectoxin-Lio3-like [Epinephelus fuscoguttatus]|uniref:C-type lectin lectoxin-Lio3-like n=1 Tax=Epinephelus fuscoguttatus TaxID=293821 RepID=UPI0020D1F29B|nr:C-type lectin lectoxin-Lio3-like [Epinephelus fuscoguttatus]